MRPHRTLTLALPKTGLNAIAGNLYLADIGIPPEVYHQLGLIFDSTFDLPAFRLLQDRPGGLFQGWYWISLA
jgi:hypothetical protein